METAEIAQLIGELEERVERLRSLYDQYFMGIERLEPTIPRKDVDRRLWLLRREQIRNTGLRFKLETTIQRYNTYQQYWMRIVREIENGTYQRDLGRAAKRFGEGAVTAFAKRRQKMFEKGQARKAERDAQRQSQAPPPTSNAPKPEGPMSAPGESYDIAFDDADILSDEPAPLSLDLSPPSAAGRKPDPAPPRAPASPIAGSPSMPAAPRPRSPAPPPVRRLTAESPGTMREVTPAGVLPAPSTPVHASRRPLPSPEAPAPGGRPIERPAPPAVRPPMASQPQAKPAAPAANAEEGLSTTRLRQIYGQYVDAKRKANESTAAITFDKVAANLRETASQLSAKHKGAIDFEVVMRNGKPVLKPVMKG